MGKTRIWRMWPMEPLPVELSCGCVAAQLRRGGFRQRGPQSSFAQDKVDRDELAMAMACGTAWVGERPPPTRPRFLYRRMQFRRPDGPDGPGADLVKEVVK